MIVAGVISGTSLDGIDVAVLEFERDFEVLGFHTVPYPPGVREAVLAISNAVAHVGEIARMNYLLGEIFSNAIKETCSRIGVPLAALNLIGSHGQTVFHEGEERDYFGFRIASTMQIGEPAVIAKRTGVPTIADFRADDIAAGGRGAPLVPLVDFKLFRHAEIARVALNIGGIANITVLPAGAALPGVLACDTGPGNMVMDALMGEAGYDRDGATARTGTVDAQLLDQLLADPYYSAPPPKTAGREQYGKEFMQRFSGLKQADAVATAAELTARTVAAAIERYPDTREVIVAGGGAHNGFLMERLRSLLPRCRVMASSELGVSIDAKEAIAFAVLAYESFHGRAGNIPSATGAQRAVILGKGCVP